MRLQEEIGMANELVFTGGKIIHATPQLPKVTSVPLNGSAVLVGYKDAPDGEEIHFDFDPQAERLRSSTMSLLPLAGSSRVR